MRSTSQIWLVLLACVVATGKAAASSYVAPGDLLLRSDLQLLNDSGAIDLPLTTWPLSVSDIYESTRIVDRSSLSDSQQDALRRVLENIAGPADIGSLKTGFEVSASAEPRFIRTFEDTPRDEGELSGHVSWLGERFTMHLTATAVSDPFDEDEFRPDGSYVGLAIGNWILSAGWQDRWWGPSRDGSLIFSTNARPTPGIMLQRSSSKAFENKWLSWIGPWSLTTFMTELDDERAVRNALLFGFRGTFRPPGTGLEIGFSRAAQWCGDDRPCSFSTFGRLLLGKDNQGVNVAAEDEPGNQRAGFDIRWRLPRQVPAALYMQWIAEDGRGGGEGIGLWNRQLGAEFWGRIGSLNHRTHIEVSDTLCRQGGFGFSEATAGCAYHHSIYSTGYRYRSKVIGHSMDGDGLSYSIGTTLVSGDDQTWNIVFRDMELNRKGSLRPGHTVSSSPVTLTDMQLSHNRLTRFGKFRIAIALSRWKSQSGGSASTDFGGFVQWSTN